MEGQDLRQHCVLIVVVNDGVAQADLYFFVDLVLHPLEDGLAGRLVALHGAVDAKGGGGVDADNEVEVSLGMAFKDEGGFADGIGSIGGKALYPLEAGPDRGGVDEGIEEFEFLRVVEYLAGQPGPVEGSAGIGFSAEVSGDVLAKAGVFVHQTSCFKICIGDGDIQYFEDLCDGGFARADAAC